jgi:HD-like signal output (HDOD) protein
MSTLFSWFSKLFQTGHGTKNNQTVATGARTILKTESTTVAISGDQQEAANQFDGDYKDLPDFVDACYFDWMAGKSGDSPISDEAFERKIIEYIDVVADSESAGANLIPRVPSVMVQLLKRMHEENVSGSDLSRIITKDVVLVAAVLNEVNSSLYNLNDKITELSQAIMVLGYNRLRMVLTKLSFTPIFNDQLGTYTKLTSAKIWEESQKRALVCYLLAKHQQVDPFVAFLAGLLHDVGLMVALRVFDRSSANGQLPTSPEFRDAIQKKSLIISSRIGQIWSLPEIVLKAIDAQITDEAGAANMPLAQVLKKADFISKTCILIDAEQLAIDLEQIRDILTESEAECLITMLDGQVSVANIL